LECRIPVSITGGTAILCWPDEELFWDRFRISMPAVARSGSATKPDQRRGGQQRSSNNQKGIVKGHNIGIASNNRFDLCVGLVHGVNRIKTLILELLTQCIDSILYGETKLVYRVPNPEIVKLFPPGNGRVEKSGADASSHVTHDIKKG
jgi:hypothetical protein